MITDWAKDIKKAIVVGAYDALEWRSKTDWIFIEPLPSKFEELKSNFPNVLNYAISDQVGTKHFLTASNGMSSSLLEPKEHLQDYPDIKFKEEMFVEVRTLDFLFEIKEIVGEFDGLVMDVQGAEHLVVKGFEKNIGMIKTIIAEVNFKEMYKGCMLEPEFTEYLKRLGFTKVAEERMGDGWGDALYKKTQ